MADSDIRLNGNRLYIEGDYIEAHAVDFNLDNPSRRRQTGGQRRALVHGFNDELVINYAGDYPGGTIVRQALRVATKAGTTTVYVDGDNGDITLGGGGLDGDLFVKDRNGITRVRIDGDSGDITLGVIGSLVQKIQNLEQRISTLEQG